MPIGQWASNPLRLGKIRCMLCGWTTLKIVRSPVGAVLQGICGRCGVRNRLKVIE
jgi:hypothetical protein